MKPKQKRVRAQRKFAQGAYIPPNTSQPTTSGADGTNIKQNYVVHRNHMSASNLLDAICLKSLHAHRSRPVVVLERLMPIKLIKEPIIQNGGNRTIQNGGNRTIQNGGNRTIQNGGNRTIQNGSNRTIQNGGNRTIQNEAATCETTKSRTSKNNTMCLRSKVISHKRLLPRKETNRKNSGKIELIKTGLKLDRLIGSSVSVSDIEDIMPLKFLKRALTSTENEAQKRVTRASTHQGPMAKDTQPNLTDTDDTESDSRPNVAKKRKSAFNTHNNESDARPKVTPRRKSAYFDNTDTDARPNVTTRRKSTYVDNTDTDARRKVPPRRKSAYFNNTDSDARPKVLPRRKSTYVDNTDTDTSSIFNDLPSFSSTTPAHYYGNTGTLAIFNDLPSTSSTTPAHIAGNTTNEGNQTIPTTAEPEKPIGTIILFKEPAIPSRFNRAVPQSDTSSMFSYFPSTSTTPAHFYGNTDTSSIFNDLPSTSSATPAPFDGNTINEGTLAIFNDLPTTSSTTPAQIDGNTTNEDTSGIEDDLPAHYYGSTGINLWLDRMQKESALRCPSESLRTVTDVLEATADTLAMMCKKCICCKRVLLVNKMSKYMHEFPRGHPKDDIYEFDTDKDEAEDPAQFYVNRRRQITQSADTGNADEAESLYINVNNDNHMIAVSSVKVPNSNANMLKAKIIPKTAAQNIRDIYIADNENLLGHLYETLQISRKDQIMVRSREQTAKSVMTLEPPEPSLSGIGYDPQKDKDQPIKPAGMSSKIGAKLVEAPTFRPTEAEFNDPISYFEKIAPTAARFGICKVVAPSNFKPKCTLTDNMRFNVSNHYISRLYNRWGPAAREMSAMKAFLATQNVKFNRVPLMDSLEVNLPKLCQIVQRYGGLQSVIQTTQWGCVAEEMRFRKVPQIEKTLDAYYVKYLLPYETATLHERKQIMVKVEETWSKKQRKMLNWSLNPLHAQKKLLGESDSSSDSESDTSAAARGINEAEECIVSGRPMTLKKFKKVASNAMHMFMGTSESDPSAIEKEYWRLVLFGTEHVCVNAASIDTGAAGYGFTKRKTDPIGKHPWNLKMLSSNSGNVLRSLGSVLGVTVPTLHLGMVFSTSCWHRDPHGLPWMEYMHQGPAKIWYGIPDEQSSNFRRAVEHLCPTSVQNKPIWLSSDITMIPPNLLRDNNVSLSRVVQKPGEYIIVFPKAYSCSISTGFTVSESVYFANISWLKTVHQVFHELRDSCEPTMFPLEQLLIALAGDNRSSLGVLSLANTSLGVIITEEFDCRRKLIALGMPVIYSRHYKQKRKGVWDSRGEECKICRASLFLSKVTNVIGKRPELCLLHALRILNTPKFQDCDVTTMKLVIYFKEDQINQIMAGLKQRLSL